MAAQGMLRDTENPVLLEQLRQGFQHTRISLAAGLGAGVLLVVMVLEVQSLPPLLFWLGLLMAVSLLRFLAGASFLERSPGKEEALRRWRYIFVAGAALGGVVWGASSQFIHLNAVSPYTYLVVIMMAGISAAAIPSLSPVRGALPAFLIFIWTPYALTLLVDGRDTSQWLAFLMLAYTAFLGFISRRFHLALRDALQQSLRNLALVDELRQAQKGEELKSANLRREVAARRHSEAELRRRAEAEHLVRDVATDLMGASPGGLEDALRASLRRISEFARVDHVLLYVTDADDAVAAGNRYARSSDQASVSTDAVWQLLLDRGHGTLPHLAENHWLRHDRVHTLPPHLGALRAAMGQLGVSALLLMQFGLQGRVGVLGFADAGTDRVWGREQETLLELLADMLGNALKRNWAEARLIEAQRAAESASQARSQFIANVSHELRTPLATVLGMTELLKKATLTVEHRGHLQVCDDAARQVLDLVNDVIELSDYDLGTLSLHPEPADMHDVLDEVERRYGTAAETKGLTFSLCCPDGLPALVMDAGRLGQILSNLVGNAIKFSEHGRVELRCELETSVGNAVCLRFLVKDEGMGIPADRLEHIIERFTQLDESDTRQFGGSGLGLAVAQDLCRLMGSELEVSSTEGEGSEFAFRLCLPLAVLEEQKPPSQPPRPSVGEKAAVEALHILLVEDTEDMRLLVSRFLRDSGHHLIMAENGQEGFERFKEQIFDLVLMDMQMPVMDGYAATEAIRQWELGYRPLRTPIVALTANSSKEAEARCRQVGCDVLIAKPLTKRELVDGIQRYVGTGPSGDMSSNVEPSR